MKEKEALAAKLEEVDSKAQYLTTLEQKVKESLEDAIFLKKILEEDIYALKDKIVYTYDIFWER